MGKYRDFAMRRPKKRRRLEIFIEAHDLDELAYCFWVSQIDMAVDPLAYVLYHRLSRYLSANRKLEGEAVL